jgi:hypothetical protein
MIVHFPLRKKEGDATRANAPEWEPGRRDTVETLLSDFVPPFPASGRRNVGALPRNVPSRQTGFWDDAIETGERGQPLQALAPARGEGSSGVKAS